MSETLSILRFEMGIKVPIGRTVLLKTRKESGYDDARL